MDTMSESKKILMLGLLPPEELHELTKTDSTVLATALIYALSELIAASCLEEGEQPNIKEIVKEASIYAIELTNGVNLVVDDIQANLPDNKVIH